MFSSIVKQFETEGFLFPRKRLLCFFLFWLGIASFGLSACSVSKSESSDELEEGSNQLQFFGIDRIEPTASGSWKVIWSPLVGVGDATYLVFQRAEEGEEFDFKEPIVRTQQTIFVSKDLRLKPSTCFYIKAMIGGAEVGGPNQEMCTGHKAFSFSGVSELVPLSSGNYLLKWQKTPFSVGEMTFEIKERLKKNASYSQAGRSTENFFATRKIGIDETVCFNVTYVHTTLPKDTNQQELCTDAETSGNFTGIKEISKADDELGGYIVTWNKSVRQDVAGYRILNGNDMKTVLGEVSPDRSSFRIRGLGVGAAYSFAVRFYTKNGRVDSNTRKISIIALNDKPVVTKVNAEGLQKQNSFGVNVTEAIKCSAEFVDPDRSLGRLYPKMIFKARLSDGERPIVVREERALDYVTLDKNGKGRVTAEYKIDETKDRKGNNLFCEVVVFDGMDKSDPVSSSYLGLPDNAGVSTGLFISKKVFYNPETGSGHYYKDKADKGPGGGAGEPGSECMTIDPKNGIAVPKADTLDICEDTVVEVLIKRLGIPDDLLLPEKAPLLQGFRNDREYKPSRFPPVYKTFIAQPDAEFNVGYFDPDRGDNASKIETRNEMNGKVLETRCLEGVCIVKFAIAKDYFSGFPYGDADPSGKVLPHAQFDYRVRTYDPGETEGVDVNGTPFVDVGWTNWAPVMVEVTGVDEKPRSTGVTVKGLEDRVQKIVICNNKNSDPECEKDKAIGFELDAISGATETLEGFGYGYSDPEADPALAILARDEGNADVGWWVKPIVANPRLENRYDWVKIGAYPTMAQLSANCNPNTEFCPFKCERSEKKCYAYFMPPENKDTSAFVPYDVVVEVDTAVNLDPAYVGKPPEQRRVQTKNTGVLTVEFAPVNDPPDTGNIVATGWKEDEQFAHKIFFGPKTSYLTDPYVVPRAVAQFPASDAK